MTALAIALVALFVALDRPGYAQTLIQSIVGHQIKPVAPDSPQHLPEHEPSLRVRLGMRAGRIPP